MITSSHNNKLKELRKLQDKKHRVASGLFVAEGSDLVEAALAADWTPHDLLVAIDDDGAEEENHWIERHQGVAVERALLDQVSSLGSGSEVVGVFQQRWGEPAGALRLYLDAIGDPGNLGTILRSLLAFADGPAILGPGCADPFSPKAVRASWMAMWLLLTAAPN